MQRYRLKENVKKTNTERCHLNKEIKITKEIKIEGQKRTQRLKQH